MTMIEHMMLASVFGCVWGWLLGSIIYMVVDLICSGLRKRKDKRKKVSVKSSIGLLLF